MTGTSGAGAGTCMPAVIGGSIPCPPGRGIAGVVPVGIDREDNARCRSPSSRSFVASSSSRRACWDSIRFRA